VAYAIVRTGGKQFKISEGQIIQVPSIQAEVGSSVELEVLAVGDDARAKIGSPVLEGTQVRATVLEHGRGRKIIVFKKKRRKQYKKTRGHRQGLTTVRIDSIGDVESPA
jgi:large subunit ribosomal protein L21